MSGWRCASISHTKYDTQPTLVSEKHFLLLLGGKKCYVRVVSSNGEKFAEKNANEAKFRVIA